MLALAGLSLIIGSWSYICGMAFVSLVFINRTNSSRHIFASLLSLYALIYALLAMEVTESAINGSRELLVSLVTAAMLINCFVTPFLTLRSAFGDLGFGQRFSIIAVLVTIAALLYLCRSLLSATWGTVVGFNLIAGTICNGLLSGFAAVNTPYRFLFPVISQGRIQRANKVIEALMKRQKYVMDTWCAKRRKINTEAMDKLTQKTGFISGILKSIKGNSSEMECEGMSAVSLALFLEIDELSSFANKNIDSPVVRLINIIVGGGISIFGIFRVLSTLVGFLTMPFIKSSPAAQVTKDGGALGMVIASEVALLVNGVMIIISLRGFLLAAFRLSTKFTTSLAAHTATLVFTSAFGVFALSQFAMSIRFLSTSHREIVRAAVGDFDPITFNFWGNLAFLVAAIAAFALRFIWASTAATD